MATIPALATIARELGLDGRSLGPERHIGGGPGRSWGKFAEFAEIGRKIIVEISAAFLQRSERRLSFIDDPESPRSSPGLRTLAAGLPSAAASRDIDRVAR